MAIPDTPCMPYMPTLTPKPTPNVGKYGIHGVSGYCKSRGASNRCGSISASSSSAPQTLHRYKFMDFMAIPVSLVYTPREVEQPYMYHYIPLPYVPQTRVL